MVSLQVLSSLAVWLRAPMTKRKKAVWLGAVDVLVKWLSCCLVKVQNDTVGKPGGPVDSNCCGAGIDSRESGLGKKFSVLARVLALNAKI